ncbi:hypothetical protein CDAR_475351 [Caerostris darwini]|uniref:Uncharacterized protein n=1 Tax=Caerostris darwini TaxID=1538125 RepID=A0AAV4PEP6_9ARAC|nr:hypothetical protein CDAR_475351 [Caerostris darwini]
MPSRHYVANRVSNCSRDSEDLQEHLITLAHRIERSPKKQRLPLENLLVTMRRSYSMSKSTSFLSRKDVTNQFELEVSCMQSAHVDTKPRVTQKFEIRLTQSLAAADQV